MGDDVSNLPPLNSRDDREKADIDDGEYCDINNNLCNLSFSSQQQGKLASEQRDLASEYLSFSSQQQSNTCEWTMRFSE